MSSKLQQNIDHLHITDQSGDRKYFVITPQLVHAMARHPYDYMLYDTIKMIAGEEGECILHIEDLAALAKMSKAKVADSRDYLIHVGLISGAQRRDNGYPQAVWHLKVADIWAPSIQWREQNNSLKKRIEIAKQFVSILKDADAYRDFDPANEQLQTLNIKSFQNAEASAFWKLPQCGPEGPHCGTKKNLEKEEPRDSLYIASAHLLSSLGFSIPSTLMDELQQVLDELGLDTFNACVTRAAESGDRIKSWHTLKKYLVHPAVAAFVRITGHRVDIPVNRQYIADKVGTNRLEFWEKLLTEYVKRGWNPNRLDLLIDEYFINNRLPSNDHKKGAQNGNSHHHPTADGNEDKPRRKGIEAFY